MRLNQSHRLSGPIAEAGFFDSYPRFFATSVTSATANRLNQRHRALIERNEAIIRGKSILDIASHDGRWSLAAHKAGARYVLGIEARQNLVDAARATMRKHDVVEGSVEFSVGDVFEEIDRLKPGAFDTVLCFGFFYHTMQHMLLLSKIARLKPTSVIMDTDIHLDPLPIIEISREETSLQGAGAVPDIGDPTGTLIGRPSKSALELMLANVGFTFSYYDWHRAAIKYWGDLRDYYAGERVSLVATRRNVLLDTCNRSQ